MTNQWTLCLLVDVCPCGDDLRSLPSGIQESPTDLDDGNLGPTVTFEVAIWSSLAPPVASCRRYGDHACS